MDLKQNIEKGGQTLRHIAQGNFLVDKRMQSVYPFLLFLAFLGFLSIRSSHKTDEKVHEINSLRKELKDVSSDYIETRSRLMEASTESEVMERAADLKLHRPAQPPVKIISSEADGE